MSASNTEMPDLGPYDQDGLRSIHNHEFVLDKKFCSAYERGVKAAGDYRWHWRVHVGLWAAQAASRLSAGGDFVECGVNNGFLSSSIMELLEWDTQGRTFYLMDTFTGIDERYITDQERAGGIMERNQSGHYTADSEAVRANFSEWKNVEIVAGPIPETLSAVRVERVAFLHLDLNCSQPEVAAFDYFWDFLVPGAFVLLDDYGYAGYRSQKIAMDAAARDKQMNILSLPTGQGLVIKPA